jgi:hypothetical protein
MPNCIASSMRMAYVITEMNALATNITLSHLDTSSTSTFVILGRFGSKPEEYSAFFKTNPQENEIFPLNLQH